MGRTLPAVFSLFATGFLAGSIQAQAPLIAGTVVAQGKPIAGAKVWVRHSLPKGDGEKEKLVEIETDAQGNFRLAGPVDEGTEVYQVIARAPEGQFGWQSLIRNRHSGPNLQIELLPVGEARGRLTDVQGQAIPNASIHLKMFTVQSGTDFNGPGQLGLPESLRKYFEPTWNTDGNFVIRGVPLGAEIYAEVSAPGFGDPKVGWNQQVPADFRLEKAGRLQIRFTGVDDVKKLAGLGFQLFVLAQRSDSKVPVVKVKGVKTQRSDSKVSFVNFMRGVKADGADVLEVENVLPGQGEVRFYSAPDVPFVPTILPKFTVMPGEVTQLTVNMAPAARIRGRTVDQKTGAGVAGVKVLINSWDAEGKLLSTPTVMTGPDGSFATYIHPGRFVVNAHQPPLNYVALARKSGSDKPVAVAAGAEHTFPDLVLEPVVPIEGVVVDAAGKPLAGVIVHSASREIGMLAPDPRTDDNGRFVLKTLAAGDVTALRARTERAVTNGAVPVDLAKKPGPIKLEVSEKAAFRLKGSVVDSAGKPVAGASVNVAWNYQGAGRYASSGFGHNLEVHRTDADGRFETTALWPGDTYHVDVSAKGFSKVQSATVVGKAGQLHDVGPLKLVRTTAIARGIVVDSTGKPVTGVTVFNQGDAPGALSMTTGTDGRFQLSGLFDGPFFVFARKTGYRFTMVQAENDAAEARITLLRSDEPSSAAVPVRTNAHIAAEQKLTAYVLDKVLALSEAATGGYKASVFECLVQSDLARAKQWLAANPPPASATARYARLVSVAEAEAVAANDTDEALTLLATVETRYAFPALLKLGGRFGKTDPARGLRFAEEAVVRARAIDLPERAESLAKASELVIRLGQKEAGQKLLAEAAGLAEKLAIGGEDRQAWFRAQVACSLAVHDLPRARALLKPLLATKQKNHWLSMFAEKLAMVDAKAALALVEELEEDRSSVRDHTRMKIAFRVAERDPADAVRIAESIAEVVFRAETLVHLAGIVEPRDRKLAWSLIDKSFALYLDDEEGFGRWGSYGGRGGFAAWAGGQAQAIGYPDMASIVARVLACRPTERNGRSDANLLEDQVRMAKVLALIDPELTRNMLDRIAPRQKLLGTGYSGFHREDWLVARCLADPVRAQAAVDEAIANLAQSKEEMAFYFSGLLQLAEVLTAAPDRRLRLVMGLNSGLSFPGEE